MELSKMKERIRLPFRFVGTAISLFILIYWRKLFFGPSRLTGVKAEVPLDSHRPAVFAALIAVTLASMAHGLFCSYRRKKPAEPKAAGAAGKILGVIAGCAVMFLNSVLCFYEVELINNYYIARMASRYRWLGIWITLAFFLFFVLATNSLSIGMFLGNILFMVWACVNYFVQQFRGIPFQWIDFGSMRTGLSVSDNYTYTPNWQMIACVVLTGAVLGFYLHARIWHNAKRLPGKIASRAAALAVFFIFRAVIFHTDVLADQGIWLRDWQPWYTYRLFGMEAGFFAFAKASYPQAPESYSQAEVARIIRESEEAHGDDEPSGLPVPENIICVMNEAFSDLSVYPNFRTDVPLTEYISSLEENTQKGELMVSVKGGTTANTEYEFLTGNSCVLSPSTVVYNSFIKDAQYSLAKTLKAQGYRTLALHPYGQYGWNRNVIYPGMGFDDFLHINNCFADAEKIRGFVSDLADYREVIRQVEQKEEGEKLFLFNITMQNHSSYKSENLESAVDVVGFHGENEGQAEQYCTLIRISDRSVEELINYFSRSKEKTLICFWGDHQPEIGDDFWEYCVGKDMEDFTFEDQQKGYMTDFFIWANYDIPEADGMVLSANYLSSYLLSLTGLEKAPYNDYLLDRMARTPAMNAYGYLGEDGLQHEWGTESAGEEESRRLEEYECLIYNELTGGRGRDGSFFSLQEK